MQVGGFFSVMRVGLTADSCRSPDDRGNFAGGEFLMGGDDVRMGLNGTV